MIRPSSELKYCFRMRRASAPSEVSTLPVQSGPNHQSCERGVAEAVGEDRPDAGLLKALDRGVGVSRRVHDVRPVDEGRDARVDALEGAPEVGREDVVGPIVRAELVEDRAEVGDQRVVRGARPDRRLPRVAVAVDEARDHDVAGGVDDLRAVRGQVGPDGLDRGAVDEDVGPRQLAEIRVLRQDDAVLDEDPVSHGCLLDRSATSSVTTRTGLRNARPVVRRSWAS